MDGYIYQWLYIVFSNLVIICVEEILLMFSGFNL